jgi:hypothetical protein
MKTLELQVPAEGIMKTNDWGDSRVYRIACNCGDETHNHNVWVEADDHDIIVTVYTTVKSNFWSKTRWHAIWTLLTKGYIDTESSVHLTKQQALNYAETLKIAIEDVNMFRNARQNKEERATIKKMANEQDCV